MLGARVVSNFSGKKDDAGVIDEEDKRSGIRFKTTKNDCSQILPRISRCQHRVFSCSSNPESRIKHERHRVKPIITQVTVYGRGTILRASLEVIQPAENRG